MTKTEDKQIQNTIINNRPHLSPSSIQVYMSSIRAVSKLINKPLLNVDDIIENYEEILNAMIETYKPSIRKTKIASFIVAIDRKKENTEKTNEIIKLYREQLFNDSEKSAERENEQKMTETQEEAYIPWEDVESTYEELKLQCIPLFRLKHFDAGIFDKLQQYVLLSCYVLIPPRRSKDYADFKINGNIDKEENNYMIIKGKNKTAEFVFNSYKNAKRLGAQIVDIPNELKNIILKWKAISGSDWLISTRSGSKITQVRINQILNQIFYPKKISSSMLRHIYLTSKFGDVDLKALQTTTKNMGNSEIARTLKYVSKEHAEKEEE